jgi:hypothetical protein
LKKQDLSLKYHKYSVQRNFTIKEIAYPFSENGICDSAKTDIPFGGMACAIFCQCADLSEKSL